MNKYLRATAQKKAPNQIKESEGLIVGVSVCSAGKAKGHGVWLDTEFIAEVVRLGNECSSGLKARFGHPNMCDEALGTYLGRFKDFRLSEDGSQALADLHLDESAYDTPNGNIGQYILTLARTSPDQFGCSIVFKVGSQFHKKNDGTKVSRQEYWREEVKLDELETDPDYPTEPKIYITIKQLLGADLVDEPAANEKGLFSTQFSNDLFATRATEFLNENPDIAEWLVTNQKNLSEFVAKYAANHHQFSTMKTDELQAKLDAAEKALAAEKTKTTELEGKVAELSKQPAVNLHAPKGGDHQETDETDFSNQPWNREAVDMFQKKDKK